MDTLDHVLAQRLSTQALTSAPMANVIDVVSSLICVQSQDAPLARWSLAMRLGYPGDSVIRAAIDSGEILRTHILRPTWHYVLAEDLRWILELTSPKLLGSMTARHRQLELADPGVVRRELEGLSQLLSGNNFLTRRQIQTTLDRDDVRGERLGHLLMIAELEGLICSGPLHDGQHTYALVEEWIAPTSRRQRDEAVQELVRRFFVGHGPASVTHLARWTNLTKTEIKAAISDLGDGLTCRVLDGEELWHSLDLADPDSGEGAFLFPLFDEAFLTYPSSNFPRAADHPAGSRAISTAEAGGGVVVSNLREVGWWKRKAVGGTTRVTTTLAPSLSKPERRAIEAQAKALAAHTNRALNLVNSPN